MANNRMFLCYKPTGRAIMLGKHSGVAWHSPPQSNELDLFFDQCFDDWCDAHDESKYDENFVLLTENDPFWNYDPNWTKGEKFIIFTGEL